MVSILKIIGEMVGILLGIFILIWIFKGLYLKELVKSIKKEKISK